MKTKPTYLTVNQVAHLAACRVQWVNSAASMGKLTVVYPFPDDFDTKSETGPKFIEANEKLKEFLQLSRGKAGLAKGNLNYNPLKVLEKHCDWADKDYEPIGEY